jgi:hypothetical protein
VLSIEICYWLELFLILYFGEVLCLTCGGCETDVRKSGVYVFYSVHKIMSSGGMVSTCSYDVCIVYQLLDFGGQTVFHSFGCFFLLCTKNIKCF